MAMTYQNFASLGVNLNRQKYGPLDISNVFTSAADLKYYLTKGTFTEGVSEYWYKNANEKIVPYPYEGQVLATVIDGVVNVYSLALDAEGNFVTQEIGAKVEVDGTTIVKDADGKLSIVAPVDPDTAKTYNFSYANGVYSWVEVDTATAAGQAQAIAGLTDRTVALETTVNGKAAVGEEGAEGYQPAVVGLVEKVAANTQAIADEAAAREAAIGVEAGEGVAATGVYAKIDEALQAAKDYADAQDDNTVYDDTAVTGRLDVIERDYLKIADKYDDTEVRGLISALDEAIGDTDSGLVKDIADNATAIGAEKTRAEAAEKALGERIDAIDFVDADELAEAIKDFATVTYVNGEIDKIGKTISNLNHFKAEVVDGVDKVTEVGVLYLIKDESVDGVDKYNEYIVVDGAPVLIGDTTTDISNYYDKDAVDGKVEAIEGAIADEATARGELAEKVAALEAIDNATQEELEAYALVVTQEILDAKQAAIDDADSKLANKLDTATFTEFKSINTAAIATAKQEAIDAAAIAEEAKGYAVATDVARDYATKGELTEAVEGIENDLLAYAKTTDVNAELAKKIETATIAHAVAGDADTGVEAIPEGITKDGTTLKIVIDAPTRAETTQMIADKVAAVTGGESAAAVKLLVEAETERSIAKDEAHDAAIAVLQGDASKAGSVAEAKALAQKGVDDAAKVADDLVTANAAIADNAREIGVAKGSIETVNTTLTEKITALEGKDTTIEGNIVALQTTVSGHTTTITEQGTKIAALENEDTRLAALIQGNTDKFAGYYTKGEVDAAVQGAIDAIPDVDFTPYLKSVDAANTYATIAALENIYKAGEGDVAATGVLAEEIARAKEAEQKIADDLAILIENPTEALDSVKELITHVQANGTAVAGIITRLDGHDTAIQKNVDDIAAINNAIAAIVQPKASTEISVGTDGTLGINEMNVNKLVQTEGDVLVLNGGNASIKAAE